MALLMAGEILRANVTRLTGTLSHLSALASKTSHALLLPFLTHTSIDGHAHLDGVILFDTVDLKGASLEFLSTVHEADLTGRDELSVLDHELEALNRGGCVHFVGSGVNKDLHFELDGTVAQTCRDHDGKVCSVRDMFRYANWDPDIQSFQLLCQNSLCYGASQPNQEAFTRVSLTRLTWNRQRTMSCCAAACHGCCSVSWSEHTIKSEGRQRTNVIRLPCLCM